MDPFDEFEFKPLTEGLGFHKKAEKLKQDVQQSKMSDEKIGRAVPERPPSQMLSLQIDDEDGLDLTSPSSGGSGNSLNNDRPASKSITDLIAALPPSLDFLESDGAEAKSTGDAPEMNYPFLTKRKRPTTSTGVTSQVMDAASRPQIFQPLGRAEYTPPLHQVAPADRAQVSKPTSLSAPTPGTPATLGSTPASAPLSARANNVPPQPTLKSPLKAPVPGARIDESFARSFPQTEKIKAPAIEKRPAASESIEPKKVSASFSAAILDAMTILGMSTIFLVIILMITKVDLVAMLSHAKTDGATHFHLALLFLCVMQLYMLSARAFFGATLGEWAFDLRMGTEADTRRAIYPLKVVWRMILVLVTGIVVLPILSKLVGRDLLALFGGPQLYKQRN